MGGKRKGRGEEGGEEKVRLFGEEGRSWLGGDGVEGRGLEDLVEGGRRGIKREGKMEGRCGVGWG